MDSRTAAHALARIAALLELRGENRFKAKAYETAANAVVALDTDDVGALYRSGELAKVKGVGPATLSVLRELAEAGESSYLTRLQEDTPEGLVEMLRIPGLGTAKIHVLHEALGITSVDELEAAARDGRLAKLPKFGAKTAERVLKGITFMRESGTLSLLPHALAEARQLVESIRRHPDVVRAEIAGAVRRHREVVGSLDIAVSSDDPATLAASFASSHGVRDAKREGSSVAIRYVDGVRVNLSCATPARFAATFWRATGSAEHVADVLAHAARLGFTFANDELRDASGRAVSLPDEEALYRALDLAWVPPELREAMGEVEAAAAGELPVLIEASDIRGVLHCHSEYSDGKATIAEMAAAAQSHGWEYIGISDHSESAFYAGGLKRDALLRQHDEIDAVNKALRAAGHDFQVLKGIEADILADGRVDYDAEILARFDYVIGSIHSRFAMTETEMTDRVLAALDEPHLTILAHPTGRLLLSRAPYEIDIDAVIAKAADKGVAVELNADPRRLDLDWSQLHAAKQRGALIEIGPDAHSTRSLDYMQIGIGMARKGWLEAADVLNTRSAEDVLAFAAARKSGARGASRVAKKARTTRAGARRGQ